MIEPIYLKRRATYMTNAWLTACKEAGRDLDSVFVAESQNGLEYFIPELSNSHWRIEAFTVISDPQQKDIVKKADAVINPNHYDMMGANTIEILAAAMTEAEWRGFCLGNTLKYRIRAGKKDDLQQDIDKANNYERLYEKHKHLCRKDKEQFLYWRS